MAISIRRRNCSQKRRVDESQVLKLDRKHVQHSPKVLQQNVTYNSQAINIVARSLKFIGKHKCDKTPTWIAAVQTRDTASACVIAVGLVDCVYVIE